MNKLKEFSDLYTTDPDFKKFIDKMGDDDFMKTFVYDLYERFGTNTRDITYPWINRNLLDIDNLIEYFKNIEDFEKCSYLNKIKMDND